MGAAGESAGAGGELAGSYAAAGTGGVAGSLAGVGGAGAGGVSGAGAGGRGGAGGTGGSAANGGSGGTGGSVAGSGGAGAGGAGGAAGGCPAQYTLATHIVMNVSWDGSLAVAGGSGKVHVWTRTKFSENGDTGTSESMSCGTVLPDITTTALGDGGSKILPEIPNASWDQPSMPKFAGTMTRSDTSMTINSGTALLGLSMTDVSADWPEATDITPVDHDGDGKAGVTAVPRNGGGYKMPPTSIAKTNRADKLYLAIRNVMTLTGPAEGCPESYSGNANVSKFENHVIGCHVYNGGECEASEVEFVDKNRTVFNVSSATFDSKIVSATATCADVRTALPMQ